MQVGFHAFITYILIDYTQYTEEFAKIDSVANIVSQLTETYNLSYGKDFRVGELGIDGRGQQWVKIDFADEKLAMMIKLQGINKVER